MRRTTPPLCSVITRRYRSPSKLKKRKRGKSRKPRNWKRRRKRLSRMLRKGRLKNRSKPNWRRKDKRKKPRNASRKTLRS